MKLAGGREIIQSGPHTALECMRPSEIKSTLLSASHNPQGGDNLDCPMMYMWSLPFLPKPCVCEVRAGGTEWGIAWSARDLMRKPRIPPTPLLSQYSERSSCLVGGTIATAIGLLSCSSKVIGFRLRAAATSRHDTEQLGRQRADLFRVCLKKRKKEKKKRLCESVCVLMCVYE